jgi:ubiquinone/menaquinone biosynthesis C-methylase UbiE
MTIASQLHLLCCPDDRANLAAGEGCLECSGCGRQFAVKRERVVELLPTSPPEVLDSRDITHGYADAYAGLLSQPLALDKTAQPWEVGHSLGHRVFLAEQLRAVRGALGHGRLACLADVSAGAGGLTFALRHSADVVLHCDLDAASISAGWQRAEREGAENLLFVRCDYLRLPFRAQALQGVVSTDTLHRGPTHEQEVLKEIRRVMDPRGVAVVDFKAVRRVYRKDPRLRFYRPDEIRDILRAAGFRRWRLLPFGCLPTRLLFSRYLFRAQAPLAWVLGPTRYLGILEGGPREGGPS